MLFSLLDKTIYFSFDRSGFKRHQRSFSPLCFQQSGQYLITGASSGIGQAVVELLAKQHQKTISLARSSGEILADLSDWSQLTEKLQQYFEKNPLPIDGLVLNAGGMPDQLVRNQQGHEFQMASQLLGHFKLFQWLEQNHKLVSGAKIIWVSSGGMLLKKLDTQQLFNASTAYDKVAVYANVKRAQVILCEELAKIYPQYFWASMHPGWVDTPAVRSALPKFYQWTSKRLRSPQQGADTIVWLLSDQSPKSQSGEFWFDRQKQKKYPLPWLRESAEERRNFIQKVLAALPKTRS